MKLTKPWKLACSLALCLVALLVFTACNTLPEGVDSENLKNKAEAAVLIVNQRDYASLKEHFKEAYQTDFDPAQWQEALDPILDESGAFVEFKAAQVASQKQNDVDMIFVVLQAKYENVTRTYTVIFDINSEMTGLYVK